MNILIIDDERPALERAAYMFTPETDLPNP